MTRYFFTPMESRRCITRVVETAKRTKGWNVRIIRRGIRVTEFFSDRKYGGEAGALSEVMRFRDEHERVLKPIPRSGLARRKTVRNTSGIPGVRRRIKPVKKGDKVFEYVRWTAAGSPELGKRKTRDFYVGKRSEDDAREAAIAQRLRWEQAMERNEQKR